MGSELRGERAWFFVFDLIRMMIDYALCGLGSKFGSSGYGGVLSFFPFVVGAGGWACVGCVVLCLFVALCVLLLCLVLLFGLADAAVCCQRFYAHRV